MVPFNKVRAKSKDCNFVRLENEEGTCPVNSFLLKLQLILGEFKYSYPQNGILAVARQSANEVLRKLQAISSGVKAGVEADGDPVLVGDPVGHAP